MYGIQTLFIRFSIWLPSSYLPVSLIPSRSNVGGDIEKGMKIMIGLVMLIMTYYYFSRWEHIGEYKYP